MEPTPRSTRPARVRTALLAALLAVSPVARASAEEGAATPATEFPADVSSLGFATGAPPGAPFRPLGRPGRASNAGVAVPGAPPAAPASIKTIPLGSFESNVANRFLGLSVATAGDVNGDGYSDIVAIGNVGVSNIALYLFFGSQYGFTLAPGFPITTLPYGDGVTVSAAGDVNGDGHADIVMGWPAATAGTVRVYLGTSTGFDIAHPFVDFQNFTNYYGQVVGTAGDVNGDGYDDVIVGSPQSGDQISLCPAANQYSLAGRVDVFYGSATGLSSTRRWTIWGCNMIGSGALLGAAAATAGDVNGDGYDDIVIGSPGAATGGRISVLYGSASGLPLLTGYTDVGTLVGSTQISSPTAGAGFGSAAITAGDVNGDGYADVVVGAPNDNTYASNGGYVRVYLGGPSGLGSSVWWWESSSFANSKLGISITPAGDLNGDGLADLLVGESGKIDVAVSYGSTMLFTNFINVGGNYRSFCTAGDFNGDGLSDVVVGDGSYTNGQSDEGEIVVYPGVGEGPTTTPYYSYSVTADGSNTGWSVSSAGDVNGDGYDDYLIGVPTYNNTSAGETNNGAALLVYGGFTAPTGGIHWFRIGANGDQLGISVCRAGDINGDGYGDIIAGAHQPGTGNGEACIWYGGPGKPVLNAPPDVTLTGFAADSQFGGCVTSGDFNGDGYTDVAVGAPQEANGSLAGAGAVYVYLGGQTGINATPAWIGRGDQAGEHYGSSLAGDGDVNGDGFTDLIVGSPNYDVTVGATTLTDAGRITLHPGHLYGSPLGPPQVIPGSIAGEWFGNAVAHVGDVNGDGFGDVAVGGPFATSTLANQGHVTAFLGGVNGLVTIPLWSQFGSEVGGGFGSSVAGAGDVDGDGLDDVLVGAVFEDDGGAVDRGVVRVYAGPLGAGAPPLWKVDGPSAFANLGHCVANAGDLDGDGFSDLLFGMPGYSDSFNRQGLVWGFPGAGGLGHHNGHALTFNRTNRVQPLGFTRDPNFDLRYTSVSAAGRTWSKMQWHVYRAVNVPAGANLSGMQSGYTHALAPNGARASEDTMQVRINGLATGIPYSWRARSLSRSVYFPTTIWESPVHSGAFEYDIRELGTWVGVGEGPLATDDRSLSAPSPNPMRNRSTISFSLDRAAKVSLAILDIQGRRVRQLVDGMQTAGRHDASWGGEADDGRDAAPGVYFYRLETGGKVTSRKLALIR
ncbi:MAG: FG-GAP-like repeat-containing protein [Candidatus Eisenbacteria bacterium]